MTTADPTTTCATFPLPVRIACLLVGSAAVAGCFAPDSGALETESTGLTDDGGTTGAPTPAPSGASTSGSATTSAPGSSGAATTDGSATTGGSTTDVDATTDLDSTSGGDSTSGDSGTSALSGTDSDGETGGVCGDLVCDDNEACETCVSDCGKCDLAGQDLDAGSILDAARDLVLGAGSAPTAGGDATIDAQALGGFDFRIVQESTVVADFDADDWFTTTEDSRSAWIAIDGDLTIPAGEVFIPSTRKQFTVVYVTGDLLVDGEISVSARGANHSADTGSGFAATAIRVGSGMFSGVANPNVPAAGALGGDSASGSNAPGNPGEIGANGRTGGGGSGGAAHGSGGSAVSGAGAPGSSFSGGSGGGGRRSNFGAMGAAEAGDSDGGVGGDATLGGGAATTCAGGGAGNPGGAGADSDEVGAPGDPGTGGVLIVIVEGTYSGSGQVTAAGADGGAGCNRSAAGGGSGGGSITLLVGVDDGPNPTAPGGQGGQPIQGIAGGDGGSGTARVLLLE